MEFDEKDLKKGNKDIYRFLGIDELKLDPKKDFYYRSKDKKSIGFKMNVSDAAAERLKEIFDLDGYNFDVFKRKLAQSISGDGQELSKINALHSSSLCALLMFYNVSDKTQFSIKIGDDIHTYTKVYFEVKNDVISSPSNMDVVLTNEKTKEILFIECKFSEYLSKNKKYKLPEGYKKYYKDKYFGDIDFEKDIVFPDGLKQLVAHYIGIDRFRREKYSIKELDAFYPNEDDYKFRKPIYDLQMEYKHISFMEVVFKFDVPEFKTYTEETNRVFKALKEIEKQTDAENKITILDTQTYQDLFVGENLDILPEKVKAFYCLNKKQ